MADLRQPADRHGGPGVFGLPPVPAGGVWLLRKAARNGLTVRPMLVTLIGYLVIIDAAINTVGWALDTVANHTLLARVLLNGWGGNMFDAGYFWHYNELLIGGAAGPPGEKAMEVGMILTVFTMRIAAGIGFLQMKRWGAPVDDHHLLDGHPHLVRLRVQHDDVCRRALRRGWCYRSWGGGSTTSSTSRLSSRSRICTP